MTSLPDIHVELVPTPDGWGAIIHGDDIEPHMARLPKNYDPREDKGLMVVELVVEMLDQPDLDLADESLDDGGEGA